MLSVLKLPDRKITIAILDTGMDSGHQFFSDIECECQGVEGITELNDACGHGTYVASVIVRTLKLFANVDYRIISIKLSDTSSIYIQMLIKGLEMCINILPDIIYLGSCNYSFNNEVASLLKALAERGVLIIVPSGNIPINRPTYPSCLDTVISCGLVDADFNISQKSNAYNVDIFLQDQDVYGVLSPENAQDFQVELNSNGMAHLSATSFSAAKFAAYSALMKSLMPTVDVYIIRHLIKQILPDKIMKNVDSLLDKVKTQKKVLKPGKISDMKYIMLCSTINLDVSDTLEFALYDTGGMKVNCSGKLRIEVYDDIYMRDLLYRQEVVYENGGGVLEVSKICSLAGVYMLQILGCDNKTESIISMLNISASKASCREN